MFGQSLGSMIVAIECFALSIFAYNIPFPNIFSDTTGVSFTYLISKCFGCINIPYVHYPTITEDMFRKVREMRPTYNNNTIITNNNTISNTKIIYYQCFAYIYSCIMNYLTDIIIVNGSWTEYHLKRIMFEYNECIHADGVCNTDINNQKDTDMKYINKVPIVKIFPPCNTVALLGSEEGGDVQINRDNIVITRKPIIISIGQYRPEKDQLLQIKSFHTLLVQFERFV